MIKFEGTILVSLADSPASYQLEVSILVCLTAYTTLTGFGSFKVTGLQTAYY